MKKPILLTALAALLAMILTACGATTATAPTAAPPAPATAPTAAPPAPATAAPTLVPTPAPTAIPTLASADASKVIEAALTNLKDIKTFRIDMVMVSQGALPVESPDVDPNQKMTLIDISGVVDGSSSQITMKGLMSAFLGADPEQGMELITVDGKSFIHGPVPLLGATEKQWYVMPADQGSAVESSVIEPDQIVGSLSAEDKAGFADFQLSGTEKLDNVQCTVYAADKAATEKMFGDLGTPLGGENTNIDTGEMKLWICDDGYLHKMELNASGTEKDKPDQQVAFSLSFHIYDFAADIKVEAPKDAAELETPAMPGIEMEATPTP